eukprot:SM004904S17351  [mRNA]  locus=s4904:1:348:- [translate_table: standard]
MLEPLPCAATQGRLIIGDPDLPPLSRARILLTADPLARSELVVNGRTYGRKAFVVAGGAVQLHGMPGGGATPAWARLAA